jgi:hypothetical protein
MPKLVGTGLNQVPMNSMLGSMAFQDISSYYRAVQGTAQNTTSGTSIDFTGIPSWVKRITVMFNGVSTNNVSAVTVRLGTSGGIETSNYFGAATATYAAGNSAISFSSGFEEIGLATAAATRYGALMFNNVSGNTWSVQGIYGSIGGVPITVQFGGMKSLAGTLDRLRLTTVNGTDTFDAGSVNLLLEG